jgi:hypothetical protein
MIFVISGLLLARRASKFADWIGYIQEWSGMTRWIGRPHHSPCGHPV